MEARSFLNLTPNYFGRFMSDRPMNFPSAPPAEIQPPPSRSPTVGEPFLSFGSTSQSSSQETNPSSTTDSDSVASLSESEAGSIYESSISAQAPPLPALSSSSSYPPSVGKLSKDSPEIRAVHNVSEQFRRKFLRSCFDNLQKEVVTDSKSHQKASHLLILTSAIEVVQQIKSKESFINGELLRLTEDQAVLKSRLDSLVADIRSADPSTDLDDILLKEPLGIPDTTLSSSLLDRQDSLQVGEVEISSTLSNRKRPADSGSDNDLLESLSGSSNKMSPALTVQKRPKKSKTRNHNSENQNGLVSSTPSVTDPMELDEPYAKRKLSPRKLLLRTIDEPVELGDPDMPQSSPSVVTTVKETLTMDERRKLAAERGLPLHLANGIPTLPGVDYWSSSLSVFPMSLRRGRSWFPKEKMEVVSDDKSRKISDSSSVPHSRKNNDVK